MMEINQKFFLVLDVVGMLIEKFIGIVNIELKDVVEVVKGYEWVICLCFVDVKFFFDEDLKQGLVLMGDGLKMVIYQVKLGSVVDKVVCVVVLVEVIVVQVGVDLVQVRWVVELVKNDLQLCMVNEFLELQGIVGCYYVVVGGELVDVVLVIDEVYQLCFGGDDIVLLLLGKVLVIVECVDMLVGGFVVGLKLIGNKDLFVLCCNVLGLVCMIIESGFELDLCVLMVSVNVGLVVCNVQVDVGEFYDFIFDCLKGYYGDKGVLVMYFNVVVELKLVLLYDFDCCLDVIGIFVVLLEVEVLVVVNKCICNILCKVEGEILVQIDVVLLQEDVECVLVEVVIVVIDDIGVSLYQKDYVVVLVCLVCLCLQVDVFFDGVMVNVEELVLCGNCLVLLMMLGECLGKVVVIEYLLS